ncbi:MAG: NAD(P)/FAD-dependent oxidoreductase [Acidobacteria bacterium]|nr:NAD(P)/FAD-dependent oxidoreductase [Acidobacteriota bacterium]
MAGSRKHQRAGCGVTRRDFLNGVAISAGASLVPPQLLGWLERAPEESPDYYPPALTGLRGSHPGSFEVAHSVRDGNFWQGAPKPADTGETFDLVVVGGGISGLSAAHFFRKANPGARILIVENHDDFGGHAKRNEFGVNGRTLLGYGGTFSIQSPAPYSVTAKGLVEELGIDVAGWAKYFSKSLYRSLGLSPAIFFDKPTFGADVLAPNPMAFEGGESGNSPSTYSEDVWERFFKIAPLSPQAKHDLLGLRRGDKDYFPGLTSEEKKAKLATISYKDFLTQVAGASPEIVKLYQTAPHGLFGVGIDAVSAQDAWGLGYLGFRGLHLDPIPGKGMNRDAIPNAEADKYFFHFPDGNASIARLLVRRLIPEAIPGDSAADVVTARANYAKLDQASSPVRIRLNSTAVRVRHIGDPAAAKEVEVIYSRGGKLYAVRAPFAVLACWHVVIPYLCSELPEKQKQALHASAKVPLLYTNVAIRNWRAFQKLGVSDVYAPGQYHSTFMLDLPVSIGDYHCPTSPEQPILIHMMKTPCRPGLPARDQHRMGRIELFTTEFSTIERHIREQLARTLGAGGFDPGRDIAAITVNRWPHGYAYEYNSLWDKFWLEGGETPCQVARKHWGRISIANADAGAYAYTDGAIDQAWRAVSEISGG